MEFDRRDFLRLAGLGGVVFASGLARAATAAPAEDFYFAQLTDSHWGYAGPANPDAGGTLEKAVAAVNALEVQPDFVVFTGDLSHTTPDPAERKSRLARFHDIVGKLRVKDLRFMPGEHDAALDRGDAFQAEFGATHYSFEHRGCHFITLDNVSDPGASVGAEQLAWLKRELAKRRTDDRIAVFTHRPLFDLFPSWDWATRDGAEVVAALMPYSNVTVFYGHIHQEHHHETGHIAHHAGRSLIFPLPAPGSVEKREPLRWDPEHPYAGLGYREIRARARPVRYDIHELPVPRSPA
jgi:hypothetical protein